MKLPRLPLAPKHPERVCWGFDRCCPADDMYCGNGAIRAPHPIELFGDDWLAESADPASPEHFVRFADEAGPIFARSYR